jgi:hypothetical protein
MFEFLTRLVKRLAAPADPRPAPRCFDQVERDLAAHDLDLVQKHQAALTPFQRLQLSLAARHVTPAASDEDILSGLIALRQASAGHGLGLILAPERRDHRYDANKALPDLTGWATPDVLRVARSIAAAKAYGELPVLADALEDAGCADPSVLGPMRRRPAPHVRGVRVAYALAADVAPGFLDPIRRS